MIKKLNAKYIATIFTALLFITLFNAPALAAYSVGFETAGIQITSPSANNTGYEKKMTIEGRSILNKIWLCLRGPNGEISVYPVNIDNGSFRQDIWLRFGAGKYTVWVGDNEKQFDGTIRFEVLNNSSEDYFSLTPSGYVNSEDQGIQSIVDGVTYDSMDDLAKIRAIHSWVTKNILYDTDAYYAGISPMNTASEVMSNKKGLCRDYSFLFASLGRAAGVPTRVVYGEAWNSTLGIYEKHAWNEALVGGKWISIDTTWDAGYISNKKFIPAPDDKYLNMDAQTFSSTHRVTSVTLF